VLDGNGEDVEGRDGYQIRHLLDQLVVDRTVRFCAHLIPCH
jgi:hypothetical protein